MNWGKGLALALASFAALMAWFIVKASQNPEPLVTEHYYEQELKHQERMDASARAKGYGDVRLGATRTSIRVVFPEAARRHAIRGQLLLQRPNDPDADRTMQIEGGEVTANVDLSPGVYNAQLDWQVDGVACFTEEKFVVP